MRSAVRNPQPAPGPTEITAQLPDVSLSVSGPSGDLELIAPKVRVSYKSSNSCVHSRLECAACGVSLSPVTLEITVRTDDGPMVICMTTEYPNLQQFAYELSHGLDRLRRVGW